MQTELLSSLAGVSFLANQNLDTLKGLENKLKKVKFKKRSVIITEGDETNSLYFIFSGKVRVFCTDENSKDVTLAIQEAGSFFGELALLSDVPRSATVEALEPTLCGVVSKADFIEWFRLHPDVALDLLLDLTNTIRNLTDKVKQLALSNAYERTVKLLLELAKEENGEIVIHNKPTQEALASMVGTSRETVSRFISGLVEGGYLIIENKTIKILKKMPAKF